MPIREILVQFPELANSVRSPSSLPNMSLGDTYKTSLETVDPTTIDDYDVCEIDFIASNTDSQADSIFESAADYPFCYSSSQSSTDRASSDLLIHTPMGIDNSQPSLQLEESLITVSTEEMSSDGNWKRLGFYFDKKRNSAFVEWKTISPDLPRSHEPIEYLSLQKRCIRFLNDIDNHKIRPSSSGDAVSNNYNKLAIHHLVAERKRRGQMTQIFSALRDLVPVKTKKAGRATFLLQTKDYVIHLTKRIEELEQRNRELEALLLEKLSVA